MILRIALFAAVFALPYHGRCETLDTFATSKNWLPFPGGIGEPVQEEQLPDGSTCLVFDAEFTADESGACWEWTGALDLSMAESITFDAEVENPGILDKAALYFGTSDGGWHVKYWDALSDTWSPMEFALASFASEDNAQEWSAITKIRVRLWSSLAGKAAIRMRNLRAAALDQKQIPDTAILKSIALPNLIRMYLGNSPWQVVIDMKKEVLAGPVSETVQVPPPVSITVESEKIDALPVFNPKAGGWAKGVSLRSLKAQECATPHLLEPESFQLRGGAEADAPLLKEGVDYAVDTTWGTVGRLLGGSIQEGQAVFASYRHGLLRIDSVILTRQRKVILRSGEPRSAVPMPPVLQEGETRLGNIWLPGSIPDLTRDHIFPILETAYPETQSPQGQQAETLLPRTLHKLRNGLPIKILAWGDSVTAGGYLPASDEWRNQFISRLRERFPHAQIELLLEAWPGHSTTEYLTEPKGSLHNYQEKVLASKPDLIVSEFVNDAGLTPGQVAERYGNFLSDFKAIGAEWIILTPHYVVPDWMGFSKEREVDEDPRPYVKGLRSFAKRESIALADASLRYGRLWRQGIPYSTLMVNSINHPDARGMSIFADSLMSLFPEK